MESSSNIVIIQNLAVKIVWQAEAGYFPGKDMSCIVHHKEYGEIGRNKAFLRLVRSA